MQVCISVHARGDYRMYHFKSNPKFCTDHFAIAMHISASTAPIRVKQKPLYSQLNAECDKHYYNNFFEYLENLPESLYTVFCTEVFYVKCSGVNCSLERL